MLISSVTHEFSSWEPSEQVIMLATSFTGGDLSDNEHEAFPDEAPAELVRGPGEPTGDAGRGGKQDLKLTSSSVSENANDEVSYEDLVRLRVVSKRLGHPSDAFRDICSCPRVVPNPPWTGCSSSPGACPGWGGGVLEPVQCGGAGACPGGGSRFSPVVVLDTSPSFSCWFH